MQILVTGANGQLGRELQHLAPNTEHEWCFTDIKTLDLCNRPSIQAAFEDFQPDLCINAAAYTNVDAAESDEDKAHQVNALGVRHLAEVCKQADVVLLHISTDFVFGNTYNAPISEDLDTDPLGVYGKTKFEGEEQLRKILKRHIIIRTAWLYSSFGNNFLKTMLRLAETKPEVRVVSDQIGTPTYARDLAAVLLLFISRTQQENIWGTYHYSNEGTASWYDFAHAIFELSRKDIPLYPIPTKNFPTPVQRPSFSVLDKSKLKATLDIQIPHWRESLKSCLSKVE